MGKTIIISQKQLNEVFGANSKYLDGEGTDDFRESPGTEISAEPNLSKRDGDPVSTDKIANSMAVKDGFWRTRGGQRGAIASLTCSKERKKKLQESNSELEGRFFSLDPTTARELVEILGASESSMDSPGKETLKKILDDGGLEYTNATTIKSRMDNIDRNSSEFQEMGGNSLYRFLKMTLDNATGMISANKEIRKSNGEENVYQKAGGTKQSGNGKGHTPQNQNIIMK